MGQMGKRCTNVRSSLTRILNHDTPRTLKPIGYTETILVYKQVWRMISKGLVVVEDTVAVEIMSAMYQSPAASDDEKHEIINSFLSNFSEHSHDSDTLPCMFPPNPTKAQKKAFSQAKLGGASALVKHLSAARAGHLETWREDIAKRNKHQMRLLLALSGVTNLRCSSFFPMLATMFVHALAPSPALLLKHSKNLSTIIPSAWMKDFRQRTLASLLYGTYFIFLVSFVSRLTPALCLQVQLAP
jgi:hypothetical protein